jgi:hypothetical protein
VRRLGTCIFAHQLQEVEYIPFESHPHLKPHVETCPEEYVCQFFLDEELPPPLRRYNGGFEIREGDCESCPYFIPAGERLLIRLWRKKSLKGRKKRAKLSQ